VALSEFELIKRYFSAITLPRDDVLLGIEDDCALLRVPNGMQLAVTMDTLVAGIHFFPDVDPEALGHKALAVNLSDLAAMGAEPAWVTLALTLPESDETWLAGFSRGFAALAQRHAVQLVGGDTTRGPLAITVQAHGLLPPGQGMRRAGARVGDLIYVTGSLGDAGLALRKRRQGLPWEAVDSSLQQRLERPEPRVAAGLALRGIATAAIDISDGLLADLGHILEPSGVGAEIHLSRIPLSDEVKTALHEERDWSLPLTTGDDYELCFTLPPGGEAEIEEVSDRLALPMTRIGVIEAKPGLRCLREDATLWEHAGNGYDHFSSDD
jgi:thiamine-monophosphate kinase